MKIRTKLSKKALAFLVIAIVSLSFVASAAVVNYLSNDVETEVNIDSPIELTSRSGTSGDWEQSTISFDIEGSEATTFQIKATKLAEDNDYFKDIDYYSVGWNGAQIVGTLQAEIYCPDGISTGVTEIVDVEATFWDGEDYGPETMTLSDFTITRINANRVAIEGPTYILWDQWGYWGEFDIVWNQYAEGAYTITVQIV